MHDALGLNIEFLIFGNAHSIVRSENKCIDIYRIKRDIP